MLYNISHLLAGIHYKYYFCKMRKLLFFSALFACFFVYAASMKSHSASQDGRQSAPFSTLINDRCYIRYDFGLSKINSVVVARNDAAYDVYISDDNMQHMSVRTVEATPVLNWAFETMTSELKNAVYNVSDSYIPMYSRLTYVSPDTAIVAVSSYMTVSGDDGLTEKLNNLEKTLVRIWTEYIMEHSQHFDKL